MASTDDPIAVLADVLLEPKESFAVLGALQPLLAPALWTALCESLEVCPVHVQDLQICLDDDDDCTPRTSAEEADL